MKNLLAFLFLAAFIFVGLSPVNAGLGKAKPEFEFSKEAYKAMGKEEKKAFRENIRTKFKEIRSRIKEAKKARKNQGEVGSMEWTGIVIFLAGLALAIVAGVLSLGLIAGLGGLIMLIGVVVFILAFADVI